MRMAKASAADLEMAMELSNALESLSAKWGAALPERLQESEGSNELFDPDDGDQCKRVVEYLIELTNRASLMRVVWGMAVLLDPANKIVAPDADALEHHPDVQAALDAKTARPMSEWHEDMGDVLWWHFPIEEAPYCGCPLDTLWPDGIYTHWTPILLPHNAMHTSPDAD